MKRLSSEIIQFFHNQGFVVVSTIDANGFVHNSCKGIVKIERKGRIYLLDLYRNLTYLNLKHNNRMSITAFDEHKFIGYCLKGKAKTQEETKLAPDSIKAWEDRIASRLTQRLLRNIRQEKGRSYHPEVFLPNPEYMIAMEIEEVVDLTPRHLK